MAKFNLNFWITDKLLNMQSLLCYLRILQLTSEKESK